MDLHFGTPARLERQIAQDLMQEQSEFDLSLPGGDTRDISASISRTPLAPTATHNSSFSRPSDSSDASIASSSSNKPKHTRLDTPRATAPPVSLAAAVHNAAAHQPSALSASSSSSSIDEPHRDAQFPDPYAHVRSTSPPLTSTPQRTVGAASTVGSRSRTIVTARPMRSSAESVASTQPYDDTTKASASRATRSSRSASALLDDLTESSIAPDDAPHSETDALDQDDSPPQSLPPQPDARDFVVYDAPTASSIPSRQASAELLEQSPVGGDHIDWRQRRAQRRRLVQLDESAVDDDDSRADADRDAPTVASSQPAEAEPTQAGSAPDTEYTATTYSSPAAARLVRQALGAASRPAPAATDSASGTPLRPPPAEFATPKQAADSEERARMKQYLLNSVRATDRHVRSARSSAAHLEALQRLQAQAQLHATPASRSEGDARTSEDASATPASSAPASRRMDRLGRANTIAAGRTPLPKGGAAELLRRGALFGLADSSLASASAPSPLRAPAPAKVDGNDDASAAGSATFSEASSNDLALAPNASRHSAMGLRANTSFPGLGAADAGTEANAIARPRLDAAKLALYQSKLNARLDAENDELKRERDALQLRLARLEAATTTATAASAPDAKLDEQLKAEKARADGLDKEAQELADLLDDKERELQALRDAARVEDEGRPDDQGLRDEIDELRAVLKERDEDVEELEARLERERGQMEEQVQQAKAFSFQTLDRIEAERDEALARIQALEAQLSDKDRSVAPPPSVDVDALQARIVQLDADKQALVGEITAKQESLGRVEAEVEMLREQARGEASRIRGLERRLNAATAQLSKNTPADATADDSRAAEHEALQEELREARARIVELEAEAAPSPLHEDKVQRLEQQKAELEERVRQYREMIHRGVGANLAHLSRADDVEGSAGGASVAPVTPGRKAVGSSPLPKSVMSLRNISALKTPRSPGPLSEASWLYNESSLGAAGVVERIAYLEGALDEANASIDAKLQQLDSAGVAHLTLAERLHQAHERIAELEAELDRLRAAAGHVGDSSSASQSKSVLQRQQVFADVHAQLEALKSRWAADNEQLDERERDLERRERVLDERSAERRQHREVLAELARFKEAAGSLQQDLQSERAKQRSMLAETRAAGQHKEAIESSLVRTKTELDAVKRKLERKVGGLEDLGRQYRDQALPDGQDAGVAALAERFQAAQDEVEALRAERNELLSQRAELHHDFAVANEKHAQVQAELAVSRAALGEHQAQLDEQIEQMEAAHAALRSKKASYEQVAGDRDRLRAERDLIVRDVGLFEQELRTLRREADRQGHDLEALRAEREQARRQHDAHQAAKERERAEFLEQVKTLVAQLKSKTHEVDRIKAKLDALEQRGANEPPPYVEEQSLMAVRRTHEQECKGLLLHIKYLKLKLTREMDRSADLAHQKTYISALLAGLVKSDAQLGRILLELQLQRDPQPPRTPLPSSRWRLALNAVHAAARINLLAQKAHQMAQLKLSLANAHHHVRARRSLLPSTLPQSAKLASAAPQ